MTPKLIPDPGPFTSYRLRVTVLIGGSRYQVGTAVRATLIHKGTRDECFAVAFPNGETGYLSVSAVEPVAE